jgi:hypothetical protein
VKWNEDGERELEEIKTEHQSVTPAQQCGCRARLERVEQFRALAVTAAEESCEGCRDEFPVKAPGRSDEDASLVRRRQRAGARREGAVAKETLGRAERTRVVEGAQRRQRERAGSNEAVLVGTRVMRASASAGNTRREQWLDLERTGDDQRHALDRGH